MPYKLSLGIIGYLGLSIVFNTSSSPSLQQTESTKGSENFVTSGIAKENLGFRTMEMNMKANFKYSRGTIFEKGLIRRLRVN